MFQYLEVNSSTFWETEEEEELRTTEDRSPCTLETSHRKQIYVPKFSFSRHSQVVNFQNLSQRVTKSKGQSSLTMKEVSIEVMFGDMMNGPEWNKSMFIREMLLFHRNNLFPISFSQYVTIGNYNRNQKHSDFCQREMNPNIRFISFKHVKIASEFSQNVKL